MIGRLGGLAGAAAMLTGGAALAQEAAPATTAPAGSEVSTQSFEPAYFVRYAPNNALDMVQQVPGFSVQEGDNVRGFGGAAGNILVNGERPSTKTGLAALLTRIPVASVIRIELVTGVSATLDMRGQTKDRERHRPRERARRADRRSISRRATQRMAASPGSSRPRPSAACSAARSTSPAAQHAGQQRPRRRRLRG